jgi:histidinol-phosphate/aromatic aminotransferase/cobyric acid decarboxylase-like protein
MVEPRPELRALAAALHGGAPPSLLDFSTGVSPLPPPPAILRAIASAELGRYPHPTAAPLTERIAERYDLAPDRVVVGAGSTELIWALARAFGGAGRVVAHAAHGFAEYRQAALASGADPRAFATLADAPSCALAFAGRPDAATLHAPADDELHAFAAARPSTLLVADEAYQPLFDDLAPLRARDNLVVLRSLTKVFALPGLRLGFLSADSEIARAVRAALPPWNVSAPAIAAGLAALDEPIEPVRAQVASLRRRLADGLRALGLTVAGEGGPFVLLEVDDARAFADALRARGIAVRDCASFGRPRIVRLGARPAAEQDRLFAALKELR